jgi:uncharacterized protein YndB with AHSA1/START domain
VKSARNFLRVPHFSLVTDWHLEAPVERIWEALVAPEDWPRWWRFLETVTVLENGGADGVGSLRRYTWTSRLPYRLSFDMRTTVLERPAFLEGVAAGELSGTGRWRLAPLDGASRVRYEWRVATEKAWMKLSGPVLAPLFAWNHDQVMLEGGRGLARHLGVPFLAFARSR